MLKIKIAGITVGIENKYPYIESIARPYATDGEPTLFVSADEREIECQMKKLGVSADYAESVAIYSQIAENLWRYDAFVMHAVAIEVDGRTYLIAAKSGVGKTTHARLWLEEFGASARIINGDKPIIRKVGGKLFAAGTPWCGKERLGSADISQIKGIALLERSAENRAKQISANDAVPLLAPQLYMPKSPIAISSALTLFDELVRSVKIVNAGVNMESSAARTVYRALTE